MQIGPVKYDKKEEAILFKSILFGLFLGLPLGVMLNYFLGFPSIVQPPDNFETWVVFLSEWWVRLASPWVLITGILFLLQYKKQRLIHSWMDIGRVIWAVFVFFPVLFTYTVLVMSAIFIPLYSVTPWLSPIRQYWLGAIMFLPFLFLFFVIFLPDQKPRKATAQMWLIIKGKAPLPRLNIRNAVVIPLILLWLVLVFLPLNHSFVNLALIAGGILAVAYLANQRYRKKSKR